MDSGVRRNRYDGWYQELVKIIIEAPSQRVLLFILLFSICSILFRCEQKSMQNLLYKRFFACRTRDFLVKQTQCFLVRFDEIC